MGWHNSPALVSRMNGMPSSWLQRFPIMMMIVTIEAMGGAGGTAVSTHGTAKELQRRQRQANRETM